MMAAPITLTRREGMKQKPDLPWSEYQLTLATDRERELTRAMLYIANMMRGNGFDFLVPLSAESANDISRILHNLAWGDSWADAVNKVQGTKA
jgi:hypothetical protein